LLIEVERGAKHQRSEPRMKVLLTAELQTPRGMRPCRILNLSRGGACLEADPGQNVGARVELRRGELAVAGTVTWARGRRFGLCFCSPIRATDLFVQMSASRNSQPPPDQKVSAAAIPLYPSR